MSRGRLRLLLAVALTLALVGPVGWLWWSSLLPSSYSAMDMGRPDHGGGPTGGHAAQAGGAMAPGAGRSLLDLDPTPDGPADVAVDLVAREGTVRLASGEEVAGYTLDGRSPGPLVEATVGELVEVRVRNEDVAGGIALHWHGVDVPNAQDGVAGVTQDAVMPGESHSYRWVAPDAGTFWYHSHQLSHAQVTGGLLGPVVIHPQEERPAVRDVLALAHLYAGTPTVNGVAGVDRVDAEPGERVRVRVVNTDNGPNAVWASAAYRLVAVDGIEVHRPEVVEGRGVRLPAGGRADLELQVPTDGSALRVSLIGGVGIEVGPPGAPAPDPGQPEERVDLLTYGAPADLGLDPTRPDRRFEYSVGRRPGFLDGRPGLWWSVNGELVPDLPMQVVAEGDVVRMTISNHSGQVHPMHLHGHHAVVLARDGRPATGSPWWFDSLDVADGASYEVAFLADNPGIWMDHCHNLKHAREGLVTHLMYDGVTTPFRLGEDSGNVPE